jgi:prevent-host-death family protein
MIIVNIHEAKTHFSHFVDSAHQGEEIIVAKSGKPWAKLVPLESRAERVPGRYRDAPGPEFFEPLPETELKVWES